MPDRPMIHARSCEQCGQHGVFADTGYCPDCEPDQARLKVIADLLGSDVSPERVRAVVENGLAVERLNKYEEEYSLHRFSGERPRFELDLGGAPFVGASVPEIVNKFAVEDGWPSVAAALEQGGMTTDAQALRHLLLIEANVESVEIDGEALVACLKWPADDDDRIAFAALAETFGYTPRQVEPLVWEFTPVTLELIRESLWGTQESDTP